MSGFTSRRWRRNLVFALTPTVLLLAGLEVAARFYEKIHPPRHVDFDAGFSPAARAFVPVAPGSRLMHTNPTKRGVIQEQSFPLEKDPGTFRVVAVGESSVNFLQPDFVQLAKDLERDLHVPHVEIINSGALSYGSQRLAIIAHELLSYKPDLLFLYLGNNEFEEVEQFRLARPSLGPVMDVFYHLAVVRVATSLFLGARVRALEREHNDRLASGHPDVARAWTTKFTMDDVTERMRFFRANVEAIVDEYRTRGIPVLMGSIPSNLIKPYLPREGREEYALVYQALGEKNFEKAHALAREILRSTPGRHQSSDLENDILRDIAAGRGIPLVDVEKAVSDAEPHHIPGETLFEDHCHLNARGRAILTGELRKAIVERYPGWRGSIRP